MSQFFKELTIFTAVCAIWTIIATPEIAKLMHRLQVFPKQDPNEDYIARSRIARCGAYTISAVVLVANNVIYPYSWLVCLVVGPLVLFSSLKIHRSYEHLQAMRLVSAPLSAGTDQCSDDLEISFPLSLIEYKDGIEGFHRFNTLEEA